MAQENVEAPSVPLDARQDAPAERHGVLGVVRQAYRRHPWWMSSATLAVVAILVLAYGGYFLGWEWTGFDGNTFWDWLSLLITPVTIASISIAFSIQQGRASLDAEERKRQDAMVETLFDHITHLLVEEHLLEAPTGSPVRAVARARTVATLKRAGQAQRVAILRFLDESGLMACDPPVVDRHTIDMETGGRPELA